MEMKARNILNIALLSATLTAGCVSAIRGEAEDSYGKKIDLVDGIYKVHEVEDEPTLYEISNGGLVCKIWRESSDRGEVFIHDARCDNTIDSIHSYLENGNLYVPIIFPRGFLEKEGIAEKYDVLLKKVRESVKVEDKVNGDIGDLLKIKFP